jgi:hypothetical protein
MTYKFLIYISYTYAIPIGNPLEKEIINRGYDVKWFCDTKETIPNIHDKKNLIHNIKDVISYKPNIVLTITDNVPDFISGLKVQIFHGFNSNKRPEKNIGDAHFRLRGFFDLYCTQGPSSTTVFKRLQKKNPYFEVIETGWSKIDPLFPIEKKEITNTILIASTFTERLSLAYNNSVFDEIKRLSENTKFNFIMVLHPKLPENIVTKWKQIKNKNFTFYDTTDLIPLFKKADIMFADTTSAIQEFLLQKKPVITFKHTFKHDYLINIKSAKEIESALIKGLKYPNEIIEKITSFINELHPYNDSKSSKRVIDACINLVHKEKSHLKNKPLNLIRKFKIRKQINYFTLKSYNKPYTIKKSGEK